MIFLLEFYGGKILSTVNRILKMQSEPIHITNNMKNVKNKYYRNSLDKLVDSTNIINKK